MSYFRIQADAETGNLLDADRTSQHAAWGDDDERAGTSVCYDIEDLAKYFASTGLEWDPSYYIVEVDGYDSDDEPMDAELGEMLIHVTDVLGFHPIEGSTLGDEFMAAVDEQLAALGFDF